MSFCKSKLFGIVPKVCRSICTSSWRNFKVTICGSAGGIGQPLSLLMKQDPLVTHLSLYDIAKINPGVATDISHINTGGCIDHHCCPEELFYALYGAHVVVVLSGLPRKPGMSRDDLFKTNAGIVYDLTCAIARFAPCACICIVTNPVNVTVPIASEVMQMCGVYDPSKIFGVTTLDLVRASTFVAEANCSNPRLQYVPVVGGHAGETIVPLLSQCKPSIFLAEPIRDKLTKRIQNAGTEVVEAKAGAGSATLSMAFSAARFVNAVMRGLAGHANVMECAYVRSTCTEADYFASPILLGCCGLQANLGLPTGLTNYENRCVQKAIGMLQKSIRKGIEYVASKERHSCRDLVLGRNLVLQAIPDDVNQISIKTEHLSVIRVSDIDL